MNFSIISQHLIAERVDLVKRRDRANADLQRKHGALTPDFEAQARGRANDDVLERIIESADQEIGLLERSLARLSDGTYGRCIGCGNPIERARLQVQPETETCLSCAGINVPNATHSEACVS